MQEMPRDDLLARLHETLAAVKDVDKLAAAGQQQSHLAFSRMMEAVCFNLFWESHEAHRIIVKALAESGEEMGQNMSFLPRLLETKKLKEGEIPVWELEHGDIHFVYDKTKHYSQKVRDTKFSPPEVIFDARPFADRRHTTHAHHLGEMLTESLESLVVNPERLLINMLGTKTVTFPRGKSTLERMNALIESTGLGAGNILVSPDVWMELVGDPAFVGENFEPVVKYQQILDGCLGTYKATFKLLSDAYRHPEHRLLQQGTIIVTAPPSKLGRASQRSWEAEPLTGALEGKPGRGMWIYNSVAMFIMANQFATGVLEN